MLGDTVVRTPVLHLNLNDEKIATLVELLTPIQGVFILESRSECRYLQMGLDSSGEFLMRTF